MFRVMRCYIVAVAVLDQVFLWPLLICSRPARAEVTLAATWLVTIAGIQLAEQLGFGA